MHLVRRIARVPAENQFTTSITLGELIYGALKHPRPGLMQRVRDAVFSAAEILPFDETAAEVYGSLRADLEKRGRRLAEADLRIAAIALDRQLVLVTGNLRHFVRVPNLTVENWLIEAT